MEPDQRARYLRHNIAVFIYLQPLHMDNCQIQTTLSTTNIENNSNTFCECESILNSFPPICVACVHLYWNPLYEGKFIQIFLFGINMCI
jgi:hypothetical protein